MRVSFGVSEFWWERCASALHVDVIYFLVGSRTVLFEMWRRGEVDVLWFLRLGVEEG